MAAQGRPYRERLVADLFNLIERAASDDEVMAAVHVALDCLDFGSAEEWFDSLVALERTIQRQGLGGFAGPKAIAQRLFSDAWLTEYRLMTGASIEDAVRIGNEIFGEWRIERLSDANPLRVLPGGALSDWEKAKSADYFELQAHHALLNPRKRGRPAGARRPEAKPRRARISEECARDTATMRLPQWAAKWAPELDITDKRQYERARGRFNSAAVRRRLNERASEET